MLGFSSGLPSGTGLSLGLKSDVRTWNERHYVQLLVSVSHPDLSQKYHTSILVGGHEYFFNELGVQTYAWPRSHAVAGIGTPHSIPLGFSALNDPEGDLLKVLSPHFARERYDAVTLNGNVYVDCALHVLLGYRLDTLYMELKSNARRRLREFPIAFSQQLIDLLPSGTAEEAREEPKASTPTSEPASKYPLRQFRIASGEDDELNFAEPEDVNGIPVQLAAGLDCSSPSFGSPVEPAGLDSSGELVTEMETVDQDKITIVYEDEWDDSVKDFLEDRAASVSTMAASLYRIDTQDLSPNPASPTELEATYHQDEDCEIQVRPPIEKECGEAKPDLSAETSAPPSTSSTKGKKKGLHLAFSAEPPVVINDDEEGGYDLRGPKESCCSKEKAPRKPQPQPQPQPCQSPSSSSSSASSPSCAPSCQHSPLPPSSSSSSPSSPPPLSGGQGRRSSHLRDDREASDRLPGVPSRELSMSSSSSSSSSRLGVPELPTGRGLGTATLSALPSFQETPTSGSGFPRQQQRRDPELWGSTGRGPPTELSSEAADATPRAGFWTEVSTTLARMRQQCSCTCNCGRRPAEDDVEELDVMLTNLADLPDPDAFLDPMEVSLDLYTILTVHDGCEEDLTSECPVCFEPFLAGEEIRTLRCMHRYHRECIDRWLFKRPVCAKCKQSVFSISA